MAWEPALTWLILGALALLNVIAFLVAQTERSQQKQLLRFWHYVGLPMGSEKVAESLRRRLWSAPMLLLREVLIGAAPTPGRRGPS